MIRARVEDVAPGALEALHAAVLPLDGTQTAEDALLDRIGDARFVLLGEATHGTHEFYSERARITGRLVREKGFRAIAIEGDWPDAYRVNKYVQGLDEDIDGQEALGGFRRFPTWMWRNEDALALVTDLRARNDTLPPLERVGFYGLDLYSLHASIEAVLVYLDAIDPEAGRLARQRYACFDRYGGDVQAYGYATTVAAAESCEDEVIAQMTDLLRRSSEYVARDGRFSADDHFHATQNARLVRNAEAYYRTLYRGSRLSWNLRDRHMMETLVDLARHLSQADGAPAKIVVWAHNSHLGDARATEMGTSGEWSLGQLVRQQFGGESFLAGFTTHRGAVTAARDWGEPPRRFTVQPALEGSYESLFHAVKVPRFVLFPSREGKPVLPEPLLERAIGVVYRPQTERQSHYFEARLSAQFDAVLHFDKTSAVVPIDTTPSWDPAELPETYPSGL